MVCCVARVHDSVQDDLKHDEVPREVHCISPVDLEDDFDEWELSSLGSTPPLEVWPQLEETFIPRGRSTISFGETKREVDDVTVVNDDLKDEGKNDIRDPDSLKGDELDDIKSYEVQEDEIKDDQVQDIIPQKLDGEISSSKDDGKDNYSINLINFPTELLIKIMFYLPSRDRMMMRNVSQRFRNVAEIPLLWKEFTLYYHDMGIMENLLKVIGEHVRKMYMDTNDIHLNLFESLSLFWLIGIVKAMPHLHHLELMLSLKGFHPLYNTRYHSEDDVSEWYGYIQDVIRLLYIIPVSVKKLDLVLSSPTDLEPVIKGIQKFFNWRDSALPSIINIFGRFNITATDNSTYDKSYEVYLGRQGIQLRQDSMLPAYAIGNLFKFWSTSAFNLSSFSSFEIRLYDSVPRPLNLFPPVPVRNYKFGPAATPTLIQLPAYDIVGLKDNIFHFSEYIDDHGMVCHAVTLDHGDCGSLIEERHITCIPHLRTVSYIDISYKNVNSNHLQELAVACPNLQQLHLQGNVNCLQDLQGLQAIVDKCKNIKSLNLAGIDVSWVESYLLMWDLLSSLKKLTLLTIDLCMISLYDSDDDDKQKLVTMCKSCHNLLALNVHLGHQSCIECNSRNENFLISHFPSLTYCALWGIEYSSVEHAFTNCRHLKYLHEYTYAHNSRCEEHLLHLSRNTVIYKRYS